MWNIRDWQFIFMISFSLLDVYLVLGLIFCMYQSFWSVKPLSHFPLTFLQIIISRIVTHISLFMFIFLLKKKLLFVFIMCIFILRVYVVPCDDLAAQSGCIPSSHSPDQCLPKVFTRSLPICLSVYAYLSISCCFFHTVHIYIISSVYYPVSIFPFYLSASALSFHLVRS